MLLVLVQAIPRALAETAGRALPQDGDTALVSTRAIRDSISAIVKQAAYQRNLADSYWDRLWRWFFDRLDEILRTLRGNDMARLVTTTLLIAAVGIVVARVLMGIRDEQLSKGRKSPMRASPATMASLADAERLAALGDYTAAAHALLAALLATSAARGEVRLHASKTTGDYARELRRRNVGWFRSFQHFRARYDRVIYGDRLCTAGDYDALARDARIALGGERAA